MITERTIRNGAVELAVYEQGDPAAETLLLLHGWPDTHHLWDNVAPRFAERFHVIAVDNRGHGKSTNPTGELSIPTLASDYAAVIDAVSPDRPVHILAHDWGSISAWEVVCRPGAEARIASFTSVSGPSLPHGARWMRSRLARPTPRNIALPLAQLGSFGYSLFFSLPFLPQATIRAALSEDRWRAGLSAIEGAPPEQIRLAPTFMDDIVNGLGIYRATWAGNPLQAQDRPTKVPVQIIVGSRDPAIRQSTYTDEAKWVDEVYLRVVKGGGHWLPFSHPELLISATLEMIDAVSGKEPARALRRSRMGVQRKPFEDQLVVITGGGSGIGRETALAFAADGAEVVLSDVRFEAAEETAGLIKSAGGVAHPYALDVADAAAVNAHAAEVMAAHGVPDVLINNAGIGQAGTFRETPAEDFDRVLNVNLHGVINGCRAFAGAMTDRGAGGHIVNLSSMAAFAPQQGFSAYATSKSAVFMFSDCLRAELDSADIGVSTICPGIVHTNIVATTKFSGVSAEDEARKQQRFDRLYERRGYGPEKVAAQIVKAVKDNKQIVPVTPEAQLQYRFNRIAPGINRFAAAKARLIR